MPKIVPSDFSYYLPKEQDTVAQGLLKFIRFSIVFWRWFRSSINSSGLPSKDFQKRLCAIDRENCLGRVQIPPGGGGSGPGGGGTGPGGGGGGNQPGGGGGGGAGACGYSQGWNDPACCDEVRNYGAFVDPNNVSEANRANVRANGTLKYYEDVKLDGITAGLDLICDNNGAKQMGVLMPSSGSQSFYSNNHWSSKTSIYGSPMADTSGSSGGGVGLSGPSDWQDQVRPFGAGGNPFDGQLVEEAIYKSGSWLNTEILIYGYTDRLLPPIDALRGAKVLGSFQTNPNDPKVNGENIRFLVESNGEWCVRIFLKEWHIATTSEGGFPLRSFRITFYRTIPYEWNPQFIAYNDTTKKNGTLPTDKLYWPLHYIAGSKGIRKFQRYLTKVNGVRVTLLGDTGHGKSAASAAKGLLKPIWVSTPSSRLASYEDVPNAGGYCIYDERWQHENKCFSPPVSELESERVAETWSTRGTTDAPSSYPMTCVNNLDVTFDTTEWKAMNDAQHLNKP